MNDLYEHKAKKYKYKYLKLKAEYIGEGGVRLIASLPGYNYLNNMKPEFLKLQKRKEREAANKANIEQERKNKEEEKRYEQIYINSFQRLPPEIKEIYNNEYNRIVGVNDTANAYINGNGSPETQITKETFLKNIKFCNEIDKEIHTDENNKEYKNYKCFTQEELNYRKKEEEKKRKEAQDKRDMENEKRKKEEAEQAAAKLAADQAAIDEAQKNEAKRKENPFYISTSPSPFNFRHGYKHDEYIKWKKNVQENENKNRVERHNKISKLFEEKDIYVLNEMFIEYKKIMIKLNRGQYNLEDRKQLTYREIINLLDKEFDTPLPQEEQNKVNAVTERVEYWKDWRSGTNGPGQLEQIRGQYGS